MRGNIETLLFMLLTTVSIITANQRTTRALPFPDASTVGILAAIATPIEVPDREVFFSYNFECNYNSPAAADLESLDALEKYDIKGRSGRGAAPPLVNTTSSTAHSKAKRGLATYLSRKIVYDFLENKMQAFGLNGKKCLLKTICQVADIALGRNNGVLGNLVHVIFTPSTSRDRVASRYLHAERAGSLQAGCAQFDVGCPRSILDYISVTNW